ncbi:MAG: NAD(P)H-binding protein [Deltaproteobacteria bacterium]|nr:NAD(P)H-binding protein [Deltaproteobacteria bacterium]
MSPPRIFVAGASGYTGRSLVEEGLERGWEVTAHLRPDSLSREALEGPWSARGARLALAPFSPEALDAALGAARPDAVFALLGTTRARRRASGGADTYERVDLGCSLLLLEACRRVAPDARYVYLSAVGVRAGATRGYYGARARMEAALRESGQPFTVLRPAVISGEDRPEERPAERLAARVSGGLIGAARRAGIRRLADRWAPRTGREIAAALAEAAIDPALRGRVVEGSVLQALVERGRRGAGR